MPDVPYPPEPGPTKAERLAEAAERVNAATRGAVTGDPEGHLRRPVLFTITALGLLGAMLGLPLAGVVALATLLLLALTDQVVEL